MSEPAIGGPGSAAMFDSSLATLRARARLAERAAPLDDSDLADWAGLCLAAGNRTEARLLHQVAAIRTGFSRQLVAAQDRQGRSTGLWSATARSWAVVPGGVVDIAIGDLKAYAAAFAKRPARITERHVADNIEAAAHRIHAAGKAAEQPPLELTEIVGTLFDRMREAPAGTSSGAETAFAALRGAANASPGFDQRDFVGAPLPLLATVIAFEAIRSFLVDHLDLIEGERGSVDLLRRAAQFDSFGVGPYFRSVSQVVRRCRDIIELAGIAHDTATAIGDGATLDFWIVLLSRSIDGPLFDEVIDELGDASMSGALDGILDRLQMAPAARFDWSRVRRIRDAGLDNLDYPLASRAQRIIAEGQPDSALEWSILGTIDGAGGRFAAAEQSFGRCVTIDPGNRDPLDRIQALRTGTFDSYAITKGFGTPEDRQLGRLRRRQGRDVAVETDRKSVIGVQVNY